jgi:hypothetical protein
MRNLMILLVFIMLFNGTFAQKIAEVRKDDLPKAILKYIGKNYRGATVYKSVKLVDKTTTTYNVAIDVHGRKQILVFDKTGKFMKKGDDLPGSVNKAVTKHVNAKNQP